MVLHLLADEDNTVLTALRALYVRLELHTLAFVGSWLPTTSLLGSDSMHDLEQYILAREDMSIARRISLARHSFMCLKYRSYQALRCNDVEVQSGESSSNDLQANGSSLTETIWADLNSWFRFFQSALETTILQSYQPDFSNAKTILECRILLIQYFLLAIRLSNTGAAARETTYDNLGDSFRAIIHHAEEAVSTKQPRLFTLDMGIIEPLYFTASKVQRASVTPQGTTPSRLVYSGSCMGWPAHDCDSKTCDIR